MAQAVNGEWMEILLEAGRGESYLVGFRELKLQNSVRARRLRGRSAKETLAYGILQRTHGTEEHG